MKFLLAQGFDAAVIYRTAICRNRSFYDCRINVAYRRLIASGFDVLFVSAFW